MRNLLLLSLLILSGCATGPGGGMQIDTVSQGQALAGASCVVTNGGQSWTVVTPASLTMQGNNADLRVICDKPGYRTSELILQDLHGGSGLGWPGPNVGVGISGGSGGRGSLPGSSRLAVGSSSRDGVNAPEKREYAGWCRSASASVNATNCSQPHTSQAETCVA